MYRHYHLGLLLLERGHFTRAAAVIRDAAAIFAEQGSRTALADAHLGYAALAASEENWPKWDEHLDAATTLYTETSVADEDSARLATLAGSVARDSGDATRARAAWMVALNHWMALGRPEECADLRKQLTLL